MLAIVFVIWAITQTIEYHWTVQEHQHITQKQEGR